MKLKSRYESSNLYCPNCGQQIPDGSAFCPKCGADLKVQPPAATGNAGGASQPGSPVPESSPTATPFPSKFDLMATINRAIALVKSPGKFMGANKDVTPPINQLMIYYVTVLALITFVGTLVGDLWYFDYYGVGLGFAVLDAILRFVLYIAAVFVIGYIVWKIAPSFGTTTNQIRATVLTAYAFTPFFLASILYIIPPLSVIVLIAALYGLYINYLGLPILLSTPKDRVVPYLVVTVVIVIIVDVIIGLILGMII